MLMFGRPIHIRHTSRTTIWCVPATASFHRQKHEIPRPAHVAMSPITPTLDSTQATGSRLVGFQTCSCTSLVHITILCNIRSFQRFQTVQSCTSAPLLSERGAARLVWEALLDQAPGSGPRTHTLLALSSVSGAPTFWSSFCASGSESFTSGSATVTGAARRLSGLGSC